MAIIKTKEDYDNLAVSLGNIRNDVNQLIKEGSIEVDGQQITLEFFLGGDYKVKIFFDLATLLISTLRQGLLNGEYTNTRSFRGSYKRQIPGAGILIVLQHLATIAIHAQVKFHSIQVYCPQNNQVPPPYFHTGTI